MTQKELSYVEDAINHEDHTIKLLENLLDYLEDEKLITYFKEEIKNHNSLKNKLIKKLEDISNGR